jgi:hypothetical protein
MSLSAAPDIGRRKRASRTFYLLAGISLLLVLLIAADGIRKGLDTIIPDYYRHKAALAIAISELAHGTSGLVGLNDVETNLASAGYGFEAQDKRMRALNTDPDQADAALRAAADLAIADRSKTFGMMLNETGMIDYYYLAFRLFGYHVRAIYAVYIGILTIVAFCFIGSFRHRAIFIVPSILYLALLFAEQHGLKSTEFGFGPLTNSRLLPFLSLYPILFCLTLIGSGRGFRWLDAIGLGVAGLVFAFVVNARTYAYWQIGPLLALVALIVVARVVPWRLPLRAQLAHFSIYPVLVFGLCAAILIGDHHWRRDAKVYSTATFAGHGYWLTYVVGTMPAFRWRIPELERESGVRITEGDSYAGALVRIKIKERGEKVEDYTVAGDWWNEGKRDALAKQIVFDLWRNYPGIMIENYLRAFWPMVTSLAKDLGLIALAVVAVGIGALTPVFWLLRLVAMTAIGGVSGIAALVAVGLRHVLPAARQLSVLTIPVSLLALCVIPTVLVMPFTEVRASAAGGMITDPRMGDVDFAVWLALLICVCGAKLQVPAAARFWKTAKTRLVTTSRLRHQRSE